MPTAMSRSCFMFLILVCLTSSYVLLSLPGTPGWRSLANDSGFVCVPINNSQSLVKPASVNTSIPTQDSALPSPEQPPRVRVLSHNIDASSFVQFLGDNLGGITVDSLSVADFIASNERVNAVPARRQRPRATAATRLATWTASSTTRSDTKQVCSPL